MDLDGGLPQGADRSGRRDHPRADECRDLPRLHQRVPLLPSGNDHPSGTGTDGGHCREHGRLRHQTHRFQRGRAAEPVQRRSPEIGSLAKGLADRYGDSRTSLSLPSTRVDAFNIELADELSRNGRRSGLTFAPEGGSERMRKVINKTVTEEDLIRTVAAAYASGWRHVKLYFMRSADRDRRGTCCRSRASPVRSSGRGARPPGAATSDAPCPSAGSSPSHTPFQWAAQLGAADTDRRLSLLRDDIRSDREYARAIGFRYHDGEPGMVEGLLARGPASGRRHRTGVARRGRSTAGRSTSPSTGGPSRRTASSRRRRCPWHGSRHVSATSTRCFPGSTSTLVWTPNGCGRTGRDALAQDEVGDRRWTPCSQCGVCDQMDTTIQIGPPPVPWPQPSPLVSKRQSPNEAQPVVQRIRLRYGKTDRLRFASHRDFQRALERAVRRAELPIAMSGGFNPIPASPTPTRLRPVPPATPSTSNWVGGPDAGGRLRGRGPRRLPDGFTITGAMESPGGALRRCPHRKSLAHRPARSQ